jgi:predicted permease
MSWIRVLLSRCSAVFRKRQLDADLDEELRAHIELAMEEHRANGMTEQQARIAALRAVGGVTQVRESYRVQRGLPWLEEIAREIRFAFRKLLHSPGFALTAILTLAVGIGANVVVFSVLNGILLRPLNVPQPDNLVQIAGEGNRGASQSYPDYRDYQDRNRSFSGILAYKIIHVSMDIDKSLSQSWGNAASGNYFDVLGLQPALGRFFHASDEHGLASAPYIVLSYDFWQSHFAASPHLIGKVAFLNQQPLTVIGVAPKNFHGTDFFFWPDYWIPAVNAQQVTGWDDFDWRSHREFTLLGRLKPGVTQQQASQDIGAIARQMAREYPEDQGLTLTTRKPGPSGNSDDPIRKALLGMTVLALLVLLAACANLASIFAARAADRSSELAIRLAIGSSRLAVARQLLTEAILVSLVGGIVGTFFARLVLGVLSHWRPGDFPSQFLIAPDVRVYIVAIVLSIGSGIVFALLPARQVWKTDVVQAIKSNYVAAGSFRRFAMRDALLLVQVAVCTLLVTSSLVAVRGMIQRLRAPLGISTKGVTLAQVDLKMAGVPDPQARIIQKRLLDTAGAIPGVTAAATSDYAPFLGVWGWTTYSWDTTQFVPANAAFDSITYSVSPGYFQVAGTHLESGRDITPEDKPGSPTVALVNETFARRMFGTTHVLGKRFKLFDPVRLEIIGVVEDGKYMDPGENPQPAIFMAYAQGIGQYMVSGPVTVLVRSQLPPDQIAGALRRSLSQVVTTAPFSILTWSDAIDRSMMPVRTATLVLGVMGLIAAILAVTGIFGMASYSVSKRMKEQGIRMALGAQRMQVMRSTLSRPVLILIIGACAGLIGGLLAARLLAHLISFPSTSDPLLLACVALVMMMLGLIGTWIPARRALAIDPARLLREC